MIKKTDPDILASYFSDTSGIKEGHAEAVLFPKSVEDVIHEIIDANRKNIPLTISGSGTGTTGGRIPFGGNVLAMEKMKSITLAGSGKVTVAPGTTLAELDDFLSKYSLIYPVDPTENSAQVGSTIANNSSGSQTFAFGPTRSWVESLKVVLPTGELIELTRGQRLDDIFPAINNIPKRKRLGTELFGRECVGGILKNASGYFLCKDMDALDLFIGSEGTLGVIVEATLKAIPRPVSRLAFYLYFQKEEIALECASLLREKRDFDSIRLSNSSELSPVLLEYFDSRSLGLLRTQTNRISESAQACIYIEQWSSNENIQDIVLSKWSKFAEAYGSQVIDIWAATSLKELAKLREIRHGLPVAINEIIACYNQPKVSMDFAVPAAVFNKLYAFYLKALANTSIQWLTFGHIGDCHLHVNLLPKDLAQYNQAQQLYKQVAQQVIALGGTISAEHGIGKLKHELLEMMVGPESIAEMRKLKREFDPQQILNIDNIFKP